MAEESTSKTLEDPSVWEDSVSIIFVLILVSLIPLILEFILFSVNHNKNYCL